MFVVSKIQKLPNINFIERYSINFRGMKYSCPGNVFIIYSKCFTVIIGTIKYFV